MMDVVIGFIPWILFSSISTPEWGAPIALAATIAIERTSLRERSMLAWVGLIFFMSMFLLITILRVEWIRPYAFLLCNACLALVALGSVAFGRPFTVYYARKKTPPDHWDSPVFKGICRIIALIWGFAFFLMTVLSGLQLLDNSKDSNLILNWILPIGVLVIAVIASQKIPDFYKVKIMKKGGVTELLGISPLQTVGSGQQKAAYRTLGKGTAVLMLSGSHSTLHNWPPRLLEELAKHVQLYLVDYPGIGESACSSNQPDRSDIVQWLSQFITDLQIASCPVIGYSLGGYFAQSLAVAHPEQVSSLCLIATDCGEGRMMDQDVIDCFAEIPSLSVSEQGKRLASLLFSEKELPRLGPAMRPIFLSAALEPQVTGEVITYQGKIEEQWWQQGGTSAVLSDLNIPCRVIFGKEDRVVPAENSLLLAEKMQQSSTLVFDDAGHGVIFQYPKEIAENIVHFLPSTPT